ncbi:GNAT family N-acetyltransferase [Rhodococcus sp. NPDC058521]|uniref:GNAT family N-acetyltransferase n=1 Tax=Rhodococcus sp. NPDC058521 TaxID=3346536 RepID=UPI0036596481
MIVRREVPADIPAIADVHRQAFDGEEPAEVGLVVTLRADPAWVPELSLVAEVQGVVVGHVCLTAGKVEDTAALALGPIGVLPSHQSTGVGSALMHAALGGADALGSPLVALLGHLDYYPRFGFVPADTLGIAPEEPSWVSHFQVRTLGTWRSAITGTFRYAPPFLAL